MTYEELVPLYDAFLDSLCPWRIYLCGSCGYHYTHPLNYCVKCPGRLVHPRWTWLRCIAEAKRQSKSYGAYEYEFRDSLKAQWTADEYKAIQALCYRRVRERLIDDITTAKQSDLNEEWNP